MTAIRLVHLRDPHGPDIPKRSDAIRDCCDQRSPRCRRTVDLDTDTYRNEDGDVTCAECLRTQP